MVFIGNLLEGLPRFPSDVGVKPRIAFARMVGTLNLVYFGGFFQNFILHEVVNVEGKFFYGAQELTTEDKHTLDFVSGTINSTMPPLVALLENRGNHVFNVLFNNIL